MNQRVSGKLRAPLRSLSPKLIFLFDVGGVLIEGRREIFQSPRFKEIIRKGVRNGIIFGLNTNRPWSEAKCVYKDLGLNGLIIAENGAYYKIHKNLPRQIMLGASKITNKVIAAIRKFLKENKGEQFCFKITDNKTWLQKNQFRVIILMTKSREFTASIYLRKKKKINRHLFSKLYFGLKKYFNQKHRSRIIIQPIGQQGKIHVFYRTINRLSTARLLKERFFQSYKMIIISDDESASHRDQQTLTFASVKNGHRQYKKYCAYVARKRSASGLCEIVQHFIKIL